MDSKGMLHRVCWSPATLHDEPLHFTKVVFLVSGRQNDEKVSAYQAQLAEQGYLTAIATDTKKILPLLTPDTIVVHLPQLARAQENVYEAVTESCTSLIEAAQVLQQHRQSNDSTNHKLFSLATRKHGLDDLCSTPLHGLARVLKLEIPDIFGGLFVEDQASFPLSAIKYARGFDVVNVSQDVAQTASLQPIEDESANGPQEVRFKSDTSYLITGGTRGVGLEIAAWMAERGAGNLLLVSRGGLPSTQSGQPVDGEIGKLISRISEIKALGTKVHVLAVDVSKPDAASTLKQAIDNVSAPPIKGVIHAAGTAGYHTLDRCTQSDVAEVLAPKVRGALCLDTLFAPGVLDFFHLTSSFGQLVGFPGQLSYAPSNAFLEGLAAHRRRQGDKCTSIIWSSWRGVGLLAQSKSIERMITKGMQTRGFAYMSKPEAFGAWDRFASLELDHVVVVRALELEADEPLRHPMLKNITPRKQDKQQTGFNNYPDHSVAIVGMACRTAAGDTPDALWDVLQAGKSMERKYDLQRFPDAATKPKLWGNFLSDVESFDHQFFKKSKREAAALDPHQRVLLETTYHALESSGCFGGGQQQEAETHDRTENGHTTGVFIGMTAPEYPINLACHPPSPYTGFGMLRSFVSGRLSHHFGWTGPSHVIDTACSSAMVSIHEACRAIRLGDCTRAVAGGVNLIPNTALSEAMRVGGFLNETGACKTFDARADGYCRGEAVGVVVLKKLDRALKDGDHIQGVLLATGNNQNINSTSITNPVLESQAALYSQVLSRAGVSPKDVSYVEAHGTGTPAGDPVETSGVRRVLGGKDRQSTLHIGAVKPNVGHSEGASGVVSLIKVLLMMKHGKIPPQAHFETLNPKIPALEPDRIVIPTSLREWEDGTRLALINNYGASGNNAAAVLAPPPPRPTLPSKLTTTVPVVPAWPIFVSANSKASLLATCSELKNQVGNASFTPEMAAGLSFALARKQNRQLPHVFSTVAGTLDDLRSQLSDPDKHIIAPQKSKPVVLLFSGQNGSTVPSAKSLYDSSLLFRKHLHQCAEVVQSLGYPSLLSDVLEGIQGESELVQRHAAMFAIQYSSAMAWIDSGVKPQALCGHSFGEWAALTVSGALTLESGMKLVIGSSIHHPEPLGPGYWIHEAKLDVACYNGPNSYVVAGSTNDVELLESYLKEKKSSGEKLRFKVLKGMHAYHSVLADSIIDESAKLSASIDFQDPIYPFESCHKDPWTGPGSNVIARNTRGAVYFTQAISRIVDRLGPSTFLEAGVGGPIIGMARNALSPDQPQSQHNFVSINVKDSVRSLADATTALWRNGQPTVQFWPFHHIQQASYVPVPIPQYRFEKNKHWIEYTGLQGESSKSAHHVPARTGNCPHCLKDITDYPYIEQEQSQSQGLGANKSTFKIDLRSRRYQDLVKGHGVVGVPLCPAGMYLEWTSHAVNMLRGSQIKSSGLEVVVDNLELKGPLSMDTERSVRVILTKKSDASWTFEVISTKNDKPLSHATGVVSLRSSLGDERDQKDKWGRITELLERDTDTEALRGSMVYKTFTPMVKYSPPYKGLKHLVGKGPEGAGDITMPPDDLDVLARTPNDSVVDPLVMDNFLQVAGIFVHTLYTIGDEEEDSEMAYLCTGMGSIGPLNRIPGSGSYKGYTKIVREDIKGAELDVFAFDTQTRKMIWSAKGLRFSRVPRDPLSRTLAIANPGMELSKPSFSSPKPVAKAVEPKKTGPADPVAHVAPAVTAPSPTPFPPTPTKGEDRSASVFSGVQEVLSKSLDVPVEEVTKEATLEELGSDSLVSSEILASLSETFQVDISSGEFAEVEDVASLCKLISSRSNIDAAEVSTVDESIEEHRQDGVSEAADDSAPLEWQTTIFDVLRKSLDLQPDEIQMDSKLEELGADSLVAGEIIGNLNDALGVDISSGELLAAGDVSSLCNLIASTLSIDTNIDTASSGSADDSSSTSNSNEQSKSPYTGATTPLDLKTASTKSQTGLIHTAFMETRRGYDAYVKDNKIVSYWDQVYPQQLDTVTSFIVEAFEKLGCPIRKYSQGEKLPAVQGTLSKYHREVPRLWQTLEGAGIVDRVGDGFARGPAPLSDPANSKSGKELSTDLVSAFPQFESTHGLLDLLGPHLGDCLSGKADPINILFGSEKGRNLLDEWYANGPEVRPATQVLCDFLSSAIHAQASDGEPFRVLEIGAGTGGTTKHLVPLLQATGLPFTYTFTELSGSLLAKAKKIFKGIEGMEFSKLNIETEPPAELQNRYHVVVSTNCVHATRDIRCCLGNIRKLVRPNDGCVALVELTQKLAWYDLVWGLLDGWWLFDDGRDYALQSPWSWERAMRDSGFAHVDWSEGASRESRSFRVVCGMAAEPEKHCSTKATSMLLHRGEPGPAHRNLFLCPDGFGSGAVFGGLRPLLDHARVRDVSVYALNSPFLRNAPSLLHPPTIEELAATYVGEIKRRQPQGPYQLGGYSIGGVLAYEAARQLLEDGAEVERLFLLDTACPTRPTTLPDKLVDFLDNLDAVGMVDEKAIRDRSRGRPIASAHFVMSSHQLTRYQTSRLPGRRMPRAVLVSARRGVDSSSSSDSKGAASRKVPRPEVAPEQQPIVSWFLDDRDDGGPLGWDELLGDVRVVRAEGNHFSMMKEPNINGWGAELAKMLAG
ncbi:hypothetical protein GGR56DRAFT_694769 [Xylariaceae sp. FL0804]|nr:hypothetical protein GGR56DRAFT_694769 [Xylariaceae sp. FL0804]